MTKAFTINNEDNKDEYLKVKEQWLEDKRKLEKTIVQFNRKYDVTKRILDLTRDRETPSPRYQSQ